LGLKLVRDTTNISSLWDLRMYRPDSEEVSSQLSLDQTCLKIVGQYKLLLQSGPCAQTEEIFCELPPDLPAQRFYRRVSLSLQRARWKPCNSARMCRTRSRTCVA